LKITVDVGVGVCVETLLREMGHDVVSIREIEPSMQDREIIANAAEQNRLVITMDKDFGELVVRDGARHAGVLLLRLDAATGPEKAEVVRKVFEVFADALPGRFSVYQADRLRIR
jgi:predicted nuclease of predicted toxin-antitoxin system